MNIIRRIFDTIFLSKNYPINYFSKKYNTNNLVNNGFSIDRDNLSKDFSKAYEQTRAS